MARLPTPQSDVSNWGTILNEYLGVEHEADGTLKYRAEAAAAIAAKADAATVTAHTQATTGVHGIANVAALETQAGASAKAAAAVSPITPASGQLIVGGPSAPIAVPYRPLAPYRKLSASDYATFEPGETWAQVAGTVTTDTTTKRSGTRSLKLSAPASGVARADRVMGGPATNLIELDVYVDAPANLTQFDMLLTPNNFTGWLQFRWPGSTFRTGWNRLRAAVRDATLSGTGATQNDWSPTTSVRLAAYANAGGAINVYVDRIQAIATRPAVSMTFDDGRQGNYLRAMPVLREYGWAACVYVVTDAIGQASYTPAGGGGAWIPLTLAQLREMQGNGWNIGSHTKTHPDLTTLTPTQQDDELRLSWEWLRDNGFREGMPHFATPYGKKNTDTLTAAKKYYETLRDASAAGNTGYEDHYHTKLGASTAYGLRYQEVNSADGTSLATFIGWIDETIRLGGWLVLVFHDVDTNSTGWVSEALFRQYLDALDARRSQIDVLTLSDYWRNHR